MFKLDLAFHAHQSCCYPRLPTLVSSITSYPLAEVNELGRLHSQT